MTARPDREDVTSKRIQRRRTKGWTMPEGAVYVGRPTLFGNPFTAPNPKVAVDAFRRLTQEGTSSWDLGGPDGLQLARNRHRNSLHWSWAQWLREVGLPQITGRDLACWCPLDGPCHADVLLELANAR